MIGFFNVIKPTGSSSTHVVSRIKKIINNKRVGHLGTLDPAASGVLPVCVGKATKFFEYFLNKDKVYFAIAEFGIQTNTLDSEGNIEHIDDNVCVTRQMIENVLPLFKGKVSQVPPLFSALKIDGVPAYELARNGKEVNIKSRTIEVFSIDLLEEVAPNTFSFRVWCTAGTYIRTLLSDIAKAIGTVANIPVIIREKSGCFNICDAYTLDQIEKNPVKYITGIEDALSNLDRVMFDSTDVKSVKNGVAINASKYIIKPNQEFLGYVDDVLFGLFESDGQNIKCKINVYEGENL